MKKRGKGFGMDRNKIKLLFKFNKCKILSYHKCN